AVAIADIREAGAAQAAGDYHIRAYTDYNEMLREEQPDVAVITLPHYLHKEAAVACAEQGCHIMLEKPMGLDVEECDQMIESARMHRVKLMVGHTQHYFAENIKAKEIIASGGIGELVMINDTRHVNYYLPNRPDWFFDRSKSGGGIFMNLGSHSVDKIQWLTDSCFTQVNAALSFHGTKGDIEGSGVAFLRTASGIPCTISQSGYGGVNRNETEIIGTRGMIKL
ncbi:Gfo/Idh/MocA family oxidoreductase, partial [Paenibacillus sepulcri]|nr:Gfo/Idh/MocA family oxidoreductase [Paenibacillus sepulcri]